MIKARKKKKNKPKSTQLLLLVTGFFLSFFSFFKHIADSMLTRDRQAGVGQAWLPPSVNICFSSLSLSRHGSTYTYVNTHYTFLQWTEREPWSWQWTKILCHKMAWDILPWWNLSPFPEYNSNQWRSHFVQKKEDTCRPLFWRGSQLWNHLPLCGTVVWACWPLRKTANCVC